jgi:Diacylglycerol kinase catalytic domain
VRPVVLGEGDDHVELAEQAAREGADVLGMAGGDGSQALVADVARRHGLGFVCIPAGTRNHFALDLGLYRDDVVAALDAYGTAHERRIDLALIGDRIFVNNASLGVYATVVQSEEYPAAKMDTAVQMLPDLLGPDQPGFDLRFIGPDGTQQREADLVLVSNNAPTGSVGSRDSAPGNGWTRGARRHHRHPSTEAATSPAWSPPRPRAGSTGSTATRSGPSRSSGSSPARRWLTSSWTARRCACRRPMSSDRCRARCASEPR